MDPTPHSAPLIYSQCQVHFQHFPYGVLVATFDWTDECKRDALCHEQNKQQRTLFGKV